MPSFENRNEAETQGGSPPLKRLTFASASPIKRLTSEQVVQLHTLLDLEAPHDVLAEKYEISVDLVASIAESRDQAAAYRQKREDSDPELGALQEERSRAFLEQTQPVSEVIRRRIREFRKARGMSLEKLAAAMTDAGYRFNKSQISRVETGTENRDFKIGELFAFADVLRVPFAELVTPDPDEKPIRAGLERWHSHEVSDWLVHGPWWERKGATTPIRGLDSNLVERLSIQASTLRKPDGRDDPREGETR